MILIDTSIWIDHLKKGDPLVVDLLHDHKVLIHPWVVGEVAMGTYGDRAGVLSDLWRLPRSAGPSEVETLRFIEDEHLFGIGIGFIDATLLLSTRLTPNTSLWTRDKRLLTVAERLGLAAKAAH